MWRYMTFGVLAFTGMAVTPAMATEPYLARPSPCDRPIPTGRPLPRQGIIDAVGDIRMIGTPTPTWRDKAIGWAGRDERVTILQECGMTLRIRNLRGLEGWIHTVAISDERKAYEAVRNRKPQTIADCELLNIDPTVIERCKAQMQVNQAHRDEIANSAYMSAEELRRFVVGRSTTAVIRYPERHLGAVVVLPFHTYYAPDGEYFVMQSTMRDSFPMRHRGRYELVGDSVCYPREGTFCERVRKVGDQLISTAANGKEFIVTAMDGDPLGVIAEVSAWKPRPVDPLPPRGAEDVAGPRL